MTHLRSLKWLNFALGAYTGVFALLLGVMFVVTGLIGWFDDQPGAIVFVVVGALVALLLGSIAAAHVVVGYLVGTGRGRPYQLALASLQLLSFPLGTAYALYALWVCFLHAPSARRFDAGCKPPIV